MIWVKGFIFENRNMDVKKNGIILEIVYFNELEI